MAYISLFRNVPLEGYATDIHSERDGPILFAASARGRRFQVIPGQPHGVVAVEDVKVVSGCRDATFVRAIGHMSTLYF